MTNNVNSRKNPHSRPEIVMTDRCNRELIMALQAGNLEVLGLLYDRHRHMVYHTALAIVGDREVASDLLQDVFLRLYHYADHIDVDRPLEPWLYRMTVNLSRTWVKRNQRSLRILEDMATRLQVGSNEVTPHDLVEVKDEWEQVQRALSDLPLAHRVVVVLYYLNGFSLQEISKTLDVPVGTVKSRLYYGRRMLQNNLASRQLLEGKKMPKLTCESS